MSKKAITIERGTELLYKKLGGAAGAMSVEGIWMTFRRSTFVLLMTLALIAFLAPALRAQNFPPLNPAQDLYLLANPRDEGIELRWAPFKPEDWPVGLQNGYTLMRETVGIGRRRLTPAESAATQLTLLENALPKPELSWEPLVDTSNFALALAGMIYGQKDAPKAPEVLGQQHGIALFAADHDFPAAIHGALGYLDTEVKEGEVYTYTISNGKASSIRTISRSARIIPPAAVSVLPEIKTKSVVLAWNRAKTDGYYSSYNVERSDNGGRTFFRLNKLPLVQILNESNYDTLQYFNDTFPVVVADIEFQYRFAGVTPFARQGPYSEVVKVLPEPDLATMMPRISEMTEDLEDNYRISWQIPVGSQNKIAYFEVQRSPVGFQGFTPRSEKIPATERSWIETNPETDYFYMVVAYDDRGVPFGSPVKLMTIFDRDPPSPPTGLSGSIDSLGNVRLQWAENQEKDVKGYRVYFANRPAGHFPQITRKHTIDTTYDWKVTMDTRAEEVWFKVKAVDYQGNYSQFSEALELTRPDFRPPTEPVIKSVSSTQESVTLRLAPSSSDDVVYHLVQRSPEGDNNWITLDTLKLPNTEIFDWSDESGQLGITYDYRLYAVDDAGLTSSSIPYPSQRTDTGERAPIENFRVIRAEENSNIPIITWSYPATVGLQGFQLYRSVGSGPMMKYRLLNGNTPDFRVSNGTLTYIDRNVENRKVYRYKMTAVFWDGGWSGFTEIR